LKREEWQKKRKMNRKGKAKVKDVLSHMHNNQKEKKVSCMGTSTVSVYFKITREKSFQLVKGCSR